jgi:thioredoxin 1
VATTKITDDSFEADVLKSGTPVLVDFWAEWCGPCKQIGPALEELSAEFAGRVKIAKVDVDSNPNAAAAMGVRGIPALFLFKDGQVVANRAGAAPKAALQSWIESAI